MGVPHLRTFTRVTLGLALTSALASLRIGYGTDMSTDPENGPESALPVEGVDIEAPEEDLLEQQLPVDPGSPPDFESEPPLEADPADVVEQRTPVDLDEPYPPTA